MPKGVGSSMSGNFPDRNDELMWSRADSNITDQILDVYLQCTSHLPKDLALSILRDLDYNVSSAVEKCNGIQQIPELTNLEKKVLLSIAPAPCTEVEVETTHERKIVKRIRKFLPHVSLSTVRDYYRHVGREECLPSSTKDAGNVLKPAYDRLLRDGRITIDWNSPYYEKPGQSRILRSSAFTPIKAMPRKIGRDNLDISMVGYSQKKATASYDSSPERNPLRTLPFNRDPFNRQTRSLPHTREPRSVMKDENKPTRRKSDTSTGNAPKKTRGRPRKNGTPPTPPTDTSTTSSPAVVYPPSRPANIISPLSQPGDPGDRGSMSSPAVPPRVSSAQGYSDSSTPPYVMGKAVKKKPKGEEYTEADAISDESPIADQNMSPIDQNFSPTISEADMERMRRSSPRLDIGEEMEMEKEEENRKRKAEEELMIENIAKEEEEGKKRKKRSSPRRSKCATQEEMGIQEKNRKSKAKEELKMENILKEKAKEKVNSDDKDKDQTVTQRLPAGTERTNSNVPNSFFSAAALAPSPEIHNGPSTSSHNRPRTGPSPSQSSLFEMTCDETQTDEQSPFRRPPGNLARQYQPNVVSQLDVYLPSNAQHTTGLPNGGMRPTVQPGLSEFLTRQRVHMPLQQWVRTPPNSYCQGTLRPSVVPRLRFPSPTRAPHATSRDTQRNHPPPPPEI